MERHTDGEVHSVSALKDPVLGRNLINKHLVVQTIKIWEGYRGSRSFHLPLDFKTVLSDMEVMTSDLSEK